MHRGDADRVPQNVPSETASFLDDLEIHFRRIEAAKTVLIRFREVMGWHAQDALLGKLSDQDISDICIELEFNISRVLK